MIDETTSMRINFRIQPNDSIDRELDRLATVLSKKYKTDIKIAIHDQRGRRR